MKPTFYPGDKVLVDESYYLNHAIADGDLVVFRHEDSVLVKRVSALAGETIEGKDGVLFRNGHALKESYVHHIGEPSQELETFPARQVPAGQLFLTGDNRDFSLDSRFNEFGSVQVSDVLGTPTYIQYSSHGNTGKRPK